MTEIILDASLDSDLNWDTSKKGKFVLDFGWKSFDPYDLVALQSAQLACLEFTRRFPQAKQVVLAKLSYPLMPIFLLTEALENELQHTLENNEVILAEHLSHFLHQLIPHLSTDVEPILQLDIPDTTPLEECILPFCKRRFEHITIKFTQKKLPILGQHSTILSLPRDDHYDPRIFSPIFQALPEGKFQCIPEELLNEYWVGVDQIVFEASSIGETGRRMGLGFEATGGEVIEVNPVLSRTGNIL